MKTMAKCLILLMVQTAGASGTWAFEPTGVHPRTMGTAVAGPRQADELDQLEALRTKILTELPTVSASAEAAFHKAADAERVAKAQVEAAQARMGELQTAAALVSHAKGKWIGGADKGIEDATVALKNATTAAERTAANNDLAKWKENRAAGVEALEQRQRALDEAEAERPRLEEELTHAQESLEKAKTRAAQAVAGLNLAPLLTSDTLDGALAKFVLLLEATPHDLETFSQRGKAQRRLIDDMLADEDLLVQMAVADGAKDAKYGRAMEIYRAIQHASPNARAGTLQRLALAIGLEHAVPRAQRNAKSRTDAPATVDPVARYRHFEQAFLGGELDAGFDGLSVWDYRMVVDGEEPDEILAWGREMLRNYRPDHVTAADERWRYVTTVRTDIRYGSQDNKYDRDDLQFFQNILMNGGVCGRRAFFGRFILRAFGVPTTARPQRGHAALAHWTSDGWVVCLGAGWGSGWTKTRYDKDLDFLATTQARATGIPFMQVKRAQWIGDVLGETRTFGFLSGKPEFWNGVALYTQRALIEDAKLKTLAAVGEDIGEANETHENVDIAKVTMTPADWTVAVDRNGVITVPATATSTPQKSTGKILFMNSRLGGTQLHYSRTGGHQPFEYTLDGPVAGRYALTARVVTPSWRQSVRLSVNDAPPLDIPLPFTVGMWGTSEPVEIELAKGTNVLRFTREGEVKGITIKDFTLTPIHSATNQESGGR